MKNLKKVISSVAALTIVASSASAFAVTFPDVETSATYAPAVQALSALGIINGDDNGLFNPDNKVTRAEFTKMAVEALGQGASATAQTTSQFADAANTSQHWAAGYIAQGVSGGWINGYDDTTFGPDDQVTFAQACKMLTAAIGYTAYAEQLGGYPAGYVNQASTTGITAGVKANNDDQLTRAQVAMLIYNALDVPLVENEYEASWNGQLVATPKKLDGKEGRDFQTLLTDKHDAYVVKGRVTVTSKGGNASGLEKDEVTYQVEVSDNFDDTLDITKGTETYTFKVGDTNAADMLFEYTEAIVQKDTDSDEWTILAINQYGSSKTVTVNADDVADDDSNINTEYMKNLKLPVYKSESSSSTTKYDIKADTVMYVNGVDAGVVTDEMIDKYILQNETGVVTLVDATETGSTSTDGKYEYIMVDYYVDAVVDNITTSSTNARVYFKFQDTNVPKNRMQWDPEDEDVDITFTLDGNKIAYTDLQENDVLSIAYDVVNESTLDDLAYYDVKVSRNVVSGTITSRDAEDNTVRVDGNDYDVISAYTVTSDTELSTEYTLYLDTFGYVAYIDEGSSDKNYGVIVAMYKGNGDDYATVRMITSDAQVVAYECKDATEADKFYTYAVNPNKIDFSKSAAQEKLLKGEDLAKYASFTKTENRENIISGQTVCTYKLTNGKIKFDKVMLAQGGADLEYRASNSKLGGYTLAEGTTKIIDMDDYMKPTNSGSTVATLSMSVFEDEATYTAYLFDKNTNSDYRFAIVLAGTSSIRNESSMAVVEKVVGTTDVDGTTCTELQVARDGQDGISVLVEGDSTVAVEGSVIAYTVGNDGYVEDGSLFVIYTPESTYAETLKAAKTDFSKTLIKSGIAQDASSVAAKYAGYATPTYGQASSKDVVLYYGVVYKKSANNLELIVKATDGVSNVSSDIESFSVNGANSYVFDYGQKAKYRVSVGSQTQSANLFNQSYVDGDKNDISWTKVADENVADRKSVV